MKFRFLFPQSFDTSIIMSSICQYLDTFAPQHTWSFISAMGCEKKNFSHYYLSRRKKIPYFLLFFDRIPGTLSTREKRIASLPILIEIMAVIWRRCNVSEYRIQLRWFLYFMMGGKARCVYKLRHYHLTFSLSFTQSIIYSRIEAVWREGKKSIEKGAESLISSL